MFNLVEITHYRMIARVTAFMEGGIKDWPSHMQDRVYAELERIKREDKKAYYIYKSWCEPGVDDEGPYVVVIARAEKPIPPPGARH